MEDTDIYTASPPGDESLYQTGKNSKPVNLKHLARDVVVLTTNGLYPIEDVLAVYGFTLDSYHCEIYRLPAYQAEYRHWQKRVEADDKALIREQARLVAEANISVINERLKDPKSKTSDVINGLRLLMEIGDMMPKKDDKMSGITVMIDFGDSMNRQLVQGHVIEHDPGQAGNRQLVQTIHTAPASGVQTEHGHG